MLKYTCKGNNIRDRKHSIYLYINLNENIQSKCTRVENSKTYHSGNIHGKPFSNDSKAVSVFPLNFKISHDDDRYSLQIPR